MALDHYFASTFEQGSPAIIRFYGWRPYCLSLGYHQPVDYVHEQKLKAAGYDMVRRPTGGRAILHAQELTYSVIFDVNFMKPRELYESIHTIISRALQFLGFDVQVEQISSNLPSPTETAEDFFCFTRSAYSEIKYQGKKIVGSAQRIYPQSILQHGSLLFGRAHSELTEFINCSAHDKIRITTELNKKTITLEQITTLDISIEKIIQSIIKQLELSLTNSINCKDILERELQAAQDYILPL